MFPSQFPRNRRIAQSLCALALACTLGLAQAQQGPYWDGQRALEKGDWRAAERHFKTLERSDEQQADLALYWQAYALSKANEMRKAKRVIERLVESHPDSEWVDDARALQAGTEPVVAGSELPESQELKLYALDALHAADPERALPLIEKVLKGDDSEMVKQRALFVLSHNDDPRAQAILVETARTSIMPNLQRAAIQSLAIQGKGGVLKDLYVSIPDTEVRASILEAYMISGDTDAMLHAARNDADSALRAKAVRLVGALGEAEALKDLYRQERDPEVREAMLQGLAMAGDAEFFATVLSTETDADLRRQALDSMMMLGGGAATPVLVEAYGRETEPDTRQRILDTLAMHGASDELRAIYEKERDPKVKRQILRSMVMLGGDNLDLIEAVLESEDE